MGKIKGGKMKIIEFKFTNENGEERLRITFNHHQAAIFTSEISLNYDRCKNLKIAQAKENVIKDFLNSFNGKKYTRKEVLLAYSKVDNHFKDVYKEEFPHGGYRNGGRPKGSKTEKTERINWAVTPEEKVMLNDVLTNFRNNKKQKQEDNL